MSVINDDKNGLSSLYQALAGKTADEELDSEIEYFNNDVLSEADEISDEDVNDNFDLSRTELSNFDDDSTLNAVADDDPTLNAVATVSNDLSDEVLDADVERNAEDNSVILADDFDSLFSDMWNEHDIDENNEDEPNQKNEDESELSLINDVDGLSPGEGVHKEDIQAVSPETGLEAEPKSEDDVTDDLEKDLDAQLLSMALLINDVMTEDKATKEDVVEKDSSISNDVIKPLTGTASSKNDAVVPTVTPNILVSNDNELYEQQSVSQGRSSQDDKSLSQDAPKLTVEQDKVAFPSQLLKSSYKMKVILAFKPLSFNGNTLEKMSINSNDLCMDIHLKNGSLIKDYGKNFAANGADMTALAEAVVKMAKVKGWKFIKASGDPEYIVELERQCSKSGIGIRLTDSKDLGHIMNRVNNASSALNAGNKADIIPEVKNQEVKAPVKSEAKPEEQEEFHYKSNGF